jgi:hypothetical protein
MVKCVNQPKNRRDPLYPMVARAVGVILERGKVVAPVDVLGGMGLLTRECMEDWRRGRVPDLERVVTGNLTRLSRLLRILRFHAHDLNPKPSWTAYRRGGRGPRQRRSVDDEQRRVHLRRVSPGAARAMGFEVVRPGLD